MLEKLVGAGVRACGKAVRKLLILLLVAMLFLGVRVYLFELYYPTYAIGRKVEFTTTLLLDPTISGNNQSFQAEIGNLWAKVPVKITLPAIPKYKYGQTLDINGIVTLGNTGHVIKNPKVTLNPGKQNPFLGYLAQIRVKVESLANQTLPQPLSSLLIGIIFGIKENMPANFLTSLQNTGVAHVIAVSGMNVTMTAAFLLSIFGYFLGRRLATFATIVGILIFSVFAGMQASIVRAAIMGTLALSGQLFGRQYSNWYGLLLAGFIMVVIAPSVVAEVGFQLSFLSTIGILCIQPLIKRLPIVGDDIATTMSAQLATVPILISTFGSYGLLSVVVNGLILWTVPVLTILGSIGVGVGLLFPFLGKLILVLTLPILWYFQKIVVTLGSMGWVVTISNLTWPLVIGYYFLLLSGIIFLNYTKRVKR